MSCGHDGCTCGHDDPTREPRPTRDHLPTVSESEGDATCCGGHGHRPQLDPDTRPAQTAPVT